MAVSVVQTTGLASLTVDVVIARPSSVTNGDLMILAFNWADSAAISTGPAPAWNFITSVATSNSTGDKLRSNLYWKKASSEPAGGYSAHFTFSDFWSYQLIVMRGQNGSTTAIDSTTTVSAGTADAIAVGNLTLSHAGSLRLLFGATLGVSNNSPTHFETPAGYTAHTNQVTATVINACSFSKLITNSGTDSTVTISISNMPAVHIWTSMTLGIAASVAGASTIPWTGSLCLMGVGR